MLVDEGAQKPEGGDLTGVIKQNSGDEVHALHVPDRLVVVGERDQHALESLARLGPLKELDLHEGALEVLIDVLQHLHLALLLRHGEQALVDFVVREEAVLIVVTLLEPNLRANTSLAVGVRAIAAVHGLSPDDLLQLA